MNYHVALVNIGRIKAALDDPSMAGFIDRLEEINAQSGYDGRVFGRSCHQRYVHHGAGHGRRTRTKSTVNRSRLGNSVDQI